MCVAGVPGPSASSCGSLPWVGSVTIGAELIPREGTDVGSSAVRASFGASDGRTSPMIASDDVLSWALPLKLCSSVSSPEVVAFGVDEAGVSCGRTAGGASLIVASSETSCRVLVSMLRSSCKMR